LTPARERRVPQSLKLDRNRVTPLVGVALRAFTGLRPPLEPRVCHLKRPDNGMQTAGDSMHRFATFPPLCDEGRVPLLWSLTITGREERKSNRRTSPVSFPVASNMPASSSNRSAVTPLSPPPEPSRLPAAKREMLPISRFSCRYASRGWADAGVGRQKDRAFGPLRRYAGWLRQVSVSVCATHSGSEPCFFDPPHPMRKVDTKCTATFLIPTLNSNTVLSSSLRTDNSPQRKEARPLSHALTSDEYNILTPQLGLVRRWLLIGYFPIHV
jgi:hypothetical protein